MSPQSQQPPDCWATKKLTLCSEWSVASKHLEHRTQLSSKAQSLNYEWSQPSGRVPGICYALATETALPLLEDVPTWPPGRARRLSKCARTRLDLAQGGVERKTGVRVGQKEVRVGAPERVVQLREDLGARRGCKDVFARARHGVEGEAKAAERGRSCCPSIALLHRPGQELAREERGERGHAGHCPRVGDGPLSKSVA